MADKQFNARIRWKRDTSANWTSNNPVLLNGEIIIVDTDSGEMRFKIGDGVKTYTQLPFEDEVVRNLININTSAITKLNGDDTTEGSVAKAIADAKSIIDADIDAVEVKADAAQTSVDNLADTVAYINKEANENIENPDIAASSVIIDSALSRTSTNPVQNATITAELDTIKNAKADWNQNDETAIDYIKNRTHYDSRVIKTIEKTFENITETKPVKLADANIDINRIVSYSMSGTDGENTYNNIVTDILIDDVSEFYNKPTGSVFVIRPNEGPGPELDYFAVPFEIPDQSDDGSDATVTYYGLYSMVDAGNILVKFEINIVSGGELKTIDPKYINDMYYVEEANVDAKGYTTYVPLQSTETAHGLTLPFETSQTWEITATNKYTSTVQQASDGTLYLGDPDISDPPFYITSTTSIANSGWMSTMGGISSCKIECLSNGNVIHTIDEKYFPNTIVTDKTLPDKLQNMRVLTRDNFAVKTSGYSVYHGNETTASGHSSHAEGWKSVSSGNYSHAEGVDTKALEHASHSEGYNTNASGKYSHAEGETTNALNDASHAEGFNTVASGKSSHAEGRFTSALGLGSHAEGLYTVAKTEYQHVQGAHNILDTEGSATKKGKYAHIVGNGTSAKRSNAYTLDWDGNGWFAGDVYVGSTSGTEKDLGSKKLIKEGDDIIIQSSTEGSTKKFKITVDDNGTLSAVEVNT